MKAPDKIYVGTIDGKKFSIVGEGYPYAKEYISKEALYGLLDQFKKKNIETDRGRLVMIALQAELINHFGILKNAED